MIWKDAGGYGKGRTKEKRPFSEKCK